MPATRLTQSSRAVLAAVLEGRVAGYVYAASNKKLVFRYEDAWRADPAAFPLSLSMPLTAPEHGHRATSAYLWGLLPDNPDVLKQWGRLHGVRGADAVGLLAHVGEECAGAVQLLPPDQVDRVLGAPARADERGLVNWLSKNDMAELLAGLRRNPAAGRASVGQGQFSLAGAQPKTALYQNDRGRWGVPRGRHPSNRILKSPVLDFEDLAYNEHFCLHLARELGLTAATSRVEHFGDETAIVVDRYDRVQIDGALHRVHQEDMCQALAVDPTNKYESDGGPGLIDIATLLARHSSDPTLDVARFLDAIILNWLLGGPDAHGKNYSILHGTGANVRLAPLYDVITVLPYPRRVARKNIQLAMGVNGERHVERITAAHWRATARAVGFSPDLVIARIRELGQRIPDAIERVLRHPDGDDDTRAIIERLAGPVVGHAIACLGRLS